MSRHDQSRVARYLIDLADDVSAYVLASRRVAADLGLSPKWIEARTSLGAILRRMTACHPAMAGLPVAIIHAFLMKITQMIEFRKGEANNFNGRKPDPVPPRADND